MDVWTAVWSVDSCTECGRCTEYGQLYGGVDSCMECGSWYGVWTTIRRCGQLYGMW
jgi:hypothetical protein